MRRSFDGETCTMCKPSVDEHLTRTRALRDSVLQRYNHSTSGQHSMSRELTQVQFRLAGATAHNDVQAIICLIVTYTHSHPHCRWIICPADANQTGQIPGECAVTNLRKVRRSNDTWELHSLNTSEVQADGETGRHITNGHARKH